MHYIEGSLSGSQKEKSCVCNICLFVPVMIFSTLFSLFLGFQLPEYEASLIYSIRMDMILDYFGFLGFSLCTRFFFLQMIWLVLFKKKI